MYAIPRPTFSERGLLFVGMMGGMPATIARMLMCFGVLMIVCMVWLPTWVTLGRWIDDQYSFSIAGIVSYMTAIIGWFFVWRSEIIWSRRRRFMTLLFIVFGFLPAAIICWIVNLLEGTRSLLPGIIHGTLVLQAYWMIGAPFIWRENSMERGERLRRLGIHAVACPDCGYNLTGLKEAKCPECGAAYTLDQLYASIAEQRAELGGD